MTQAWYLYCMQYKTCDSTCDQDRTHLSDDHLSTTLQQQEAAAQAVHCQDGDNDGSHIDEADDHAGQQGIAC